MRSWLAGLALRSMPACGGNFTTLLAALHASLGSSDPGPCPILIPSAPGPPRASRSGAGGLVVHGGHHAARNSGDPHCDRESRGPRTIALAAERASGEGFACTADPSCSRHDLRTSKNASSHVLPNGHVAR